MGGPVLLGRAGRAVEKTESTKTQLGVSGRSEMTRRKVESSGKGGRELNALVELVVG